MIIAGGTGTRHGWTVGQERGVQWVLERTKPELVVHGGCVGFDKQFDWLCEGTYGIPRRVYPASNVPDKLKAKIDRTGEVEFMSPAPAPGRNLLIILDSTFMIACPSSDRMPGDLRGQGTWHAVSHTRKHLRPLFLIVPTGIILQERMTPELLALINKPKITRVFLSEQIARGITLRPRHAM